MKENSDYRINKQEKQIIILNQTLHRLDSKLQQSCSENQKLKNLLSKLKEKFEKCEETQKNDEQSIQSLKQCRQILSNENKLYEKFILSSSAKSKVMIEVTQALEIEFQSKLGSLKDLEVQKHKEQTIEDIIEACKRNSIKKEEVLNSFLEELFNNITELVHLYSGMFSEKNYTIDLMTRELEERKADIQKLQQSLHNLDTQHLLYQNQINSELESWKQAYYVQMKESEENLNNFVKSEEQLKIREQSINTMFNEESNLKEYIHLLKSQMSTGEFLNDQEYALKKNTKDEIQELKVKLAKYVGIWRKKCFELVNMEKRYDELKNHLENLIQKNSNISSPKTEDFPDKQILIFCQKQASELLYQNDLLRNELVKNNISFPNKESFIQQEPIIYQSYDDMIYKYNNLLELYLKLKHSIQITQDQRANQTLDQGKCDCDRKTQQLEKIIRDLRSKVCILEQAKQSEEGAQLEEKPNVNVLNHFKEITKMQQIIQEQNEIIGQQISQVPRNNDIIDDKELENIHSSTNNEELNVIWLLKKNLELLRKENEEIKKNISPWGKQCDQIEKSNEVCLHELQEKIKSLERSLKIIQNNTNREFENLKSILNKERNQEKPYSFFQEVLILRAEVYQLKDLLQLYTDEVSLDVDDFSVILNKLKIISDKLYTKFATFHEQIKQHEIEIKGFMLAYQHTKKDEMPDIQTSNYAPSDREQYLLEQEKQINKGLIDEVNLLRESLMKEIEKNLNLSNEKVKENEQMKVCIQKVQDLSEKLINLEEESEKFRVIKEKELKVMAAEKEVLEFKLIETEKDNKSLKRRINNLEQISSEKPFTFQGSNLTYLEQTNQLIEYLKNKSQEDTIENEKLKTKLISVKENFLKTKKQYYDEIKVLQLERLKLKERDILSNEAKTKFVKQILDKNNQLRKENDEKDKKIKTFESGSFQEEPPEYDSDLVERLLTVLENSQLQLKDNLYSKKKSVIL